MRTVMKRSNRLNITKWILGLVLGMALATPAQAQPVGIEKMTSDSAIIFESPHPLLETQAEADARLDKSWGFGAFFSDYGFGAGLYLSSKFGQDFTGMLSTDFGSAKADKEFGFQNELKVNRLFVIPVMASIQYRVLRASLGENFRPYVAGGAGPVLILTTPGNEEFFSSLGRAKIHPVPGGFVGAGANFGVDKSTTFGANIRYFIIPKVDPPIESVQGNYVDNLNGLFLGVNYGFNF